MKRNFNGGTFMMTSFVSLTGGTAWLGVTSKGLRGGAFLGLTTTWGVSGCCCWGCCLDLKNFEGALGATEI